MAVLIKETSTEKPKLMTVHKYKDEDTQVEKIVYASININVNELEDGTYEWDRLELPDYALDNIYNADEETKYGVLIAHIVTSYYNNHDMTAIMSNYLLEPDNEKYKERFTNMQQLRRLAKDTVKQIIAEKLF